VGARAGHEAVAAASGDTPGGDDGGAPGASRDKTEHLRARLSKWCDAAVEKITQDMDQLEMHSAVRNVMRLFDRIKDFEKRVLAREPELNAANHEALLAALELHARLLAPFAPHLAEELGLAFGNVDDGSQTPWPGVSFGVPA
jgi:leucyl-tRNA synthetase